MDGRIDHPFTVNGMTCYDENSEDDVSRDLVLVNSEDVPSHDLANQLLNHDTCICKTQPIIKLKSKGAVLILVITGLIDISYNGALGTILSALLSHVLDYHQVGVTSFLGVLIVRSIPQLAYPIAGWLADVHFGHYKVIMSGLWLMLVGYVMIFITFLTKLFYDTHWGMYVAYFGIFPVAFLTINSGLAAFNANIIPFGLDQMPGASTEQLSAFIHWYYAARNILAGVIPLIPCFIGPHSEIAFIANSVVEFLCVLLALLLGYGLKRWLIIEPQSENPFKTVYNVLKFARQHKSPVLRSSFTYWEEEIPKRIDLAKQKYGGPYSTEKVEDVKTVIRIAVVFLTLFGYVIAYFVTTMGIRLFERKILHTDLRHFKCHLGYLVTIEIDSILVSLSMALFELVIRPLFGAFIPSMLKRIALGIIIGLSATMTLMILDIQGYQDLVPLTLSNSSSSFNDQSLCYIVNGTKEELFEMEGAHIAIVYILIALSEMLVYIAVLEFIVAQSPYGMRGLLIGTFYCFRGLFAFLGGVLVLSFSLGYEHHPQSTSSVVGCAVPLYVVTLFIGIVGMVCFVVISKRYKNRERDEHVNTHTIAENYYGSIIKSRFLRRINKKEVKTVING